MKKLFEVYYEIYGDDGWYEKGESIRAKDIDDAKTIVSAMEHDSVYPIEIFSVAECGKIA